MLENYLNKLLPGKFTVDKKEEVKILLKRLTVKEIFEKYDVSEELITHLLAIKVTEKKFNLN